MRAKVEMAAADLGYTPNALASSLTTGRTRLIGLVSNNFHNPFFLEVFDLFTRGLQDRGLRPLLVNLSDDFGRAFRDAKIPVVHSFGRHTTNPQVHVVGIDNVECGRIAARELNGRGYRKVAFLGGPVDATSTQDRLEGFASEVKAHPEITFSQSFADAYSFNAGRTEMMRLIEQKVVNLFLMMLVLLV